MLCVIYTEKLEEIVVTRREFEQRKSWRGKFFRDDDPGASQEYHQKQCPCVPVLLLLRSDEKRGKTAIYLEFFSFNATLLEVAPAPLRFEVGGKVGKVTREKVLKARK